jgi:Tfp pilus assembly protein PilO
MSRFLSLDDLQKNREETKARKADIQKQLNKAIDWKKYKEEKKELKKRKRYAWMLED